MSVTIFTPIVLAGAAAAAVAFAPTAAATSTADCDQTSLASICSKTGHAAIVATPGNTSPGNAGYWPFGGGPTPPVWALD